MRAKILNGVVVSYPYDLFADHPNVSFPSIITPELLIEHGVVEVVVTGQPAHDPINQTCIEVEPVYNTALSRWEQSWVVRQATADEIAGRIPSSVTMRQARLALLGVGLLTNVNDAVAAMPGLEGEAARIEWEYSTEVRRDSVLVVSVSAVLGMTPAQVDNLFVIASAL